ncbi:MAG TPA: hypothetical protein VHT34_10615 [Clostridia bacterium]|nr:hypothetical protein [Clostridia bacterium]
MDKLTTTSHDYMLNLWTTRIKECRKSGMTVVAWCEQNNIGVKTYYYWMRKIKREVFESLSSDTQTITGSNALVFSKINPPVNDQTESHGTVTIHLNGITVDVQDGASEMIIQNTLRAIRSLC